MTDSIGEPERAGPGWSATAEAWIQKGFEQHGCRQTGAAEPIKLRHWASVWRIPTDQGAIYFKVTAPNLTHEAGLTDALAQWYPDIIATVWAADAERGWLLLPDGGTRLREVIRSDRDLNHWKTLLPLYAELQIALASRMEALQARNIPDRRLTQLPELYERLLTEKTLLYPPSSSALTSEEQTRLHSLTARLNALCDMLAAFPVPESLHHGDLHDGNIFFNQGEFRIFDWGDASLSHPFVSLRTVFVSVENSLDLEEDAPEMELLRDAYLEPWTRFASRSDLQALCRSAQQLAPLITALTWQRILAPLPKPIAEDDTAPVPALLREFLACQQKADLPS